MSNLKLEFLADIAAYRNKPRFLIAFWASHEVSHSCRHRVFAAKPSGEKQS
jgi:hypothetical protein